MYTPKNITTLKSHEIFVFGSNMAGRHGKGAAKTAMKFGAKYGQAVGLQGNTYAIPTVNKYISGPISIDSINFYVNSFIEFAKTRQDLTFLVTPIGCGLAGLKISDIAPLFRAATGIKNIILPEIFVKNI